MIALKRNYKTGYLLLAIYSVYMFLFVDGISEEPLFRGYSTILILYAFLLAVVGICEINFVHNRRIKLDVGVVLYLAFILLYLINMIRPESSLKTALRFMSFLTVPFINGYFFKKYDLINDFVLISFFIPAISLIYRFIVAGAPFAVYANLYRILNQSRYRINFGFYHVNAGGSLSACVIILSFYIFLIIIPNIRNNSLKFIANLLLLFIDFILITVLLSTGSRNAILSVVLWLVIWFYYKILLLKQWTRRAQFGLRLLTLLIVGFIFWAFLGEYAVELFISSNRLKNFTLNLPLLDSSWKYIFGVGIKAVGGELSANYAVDNYYLYLLLTLGIMGLVIVSVALIGLLYFLHEKLLSTVDQKYIIIFAIMVCHLVSGMAENCVIYYVFPSSMIYFTLYFSCCFGDCVRKQK